MRVFSIFLALTVTVNGRENAQPEGEFQHARKLSESFYMYWGSTNSSVTFEVHGYTTGWVGIGFSSKGSMIGADIVVGWVKGNTAVITDRHGTSINAFPPLDPNQNLQAVSGKEIDGWTIITFTRQRVTCEQEYDRSLTDGTVRVIWALGESDPISNQLTAADKHKSTDTGSAPMYLFRGTDTANENNYTGPEFRRFDITTRNLTLPARRTHYNCRIVKLPTLTTKHHIVRMEPVIENIRNVHHMLIFTCPTSWTPEGIWQPDTDVRCGVEGTPKPDCNHILTGWAVGGLAVTFPEETGLPLGENNGSMYVLLETHYDNIDIQEGIVDSSGMRLVYTPNLRKYDTGIFGVVQHIGGLHHFIPPRAESFTTKVPCKSICLDSVIRSSENQSLAVHHVLLHSHLAGRKMKMRHFRDGKELPYVMYDNTYDFEYQEYVKLDPYVTILPGDELQLECTYSTEGRDYVTEGGDGTHHEMCVGYISYYPAVDFDGCAAFTHPNDSLQYFGITSYDRTSSDWYNLQSYSVTSPPAISGKTVLDVISEHNWTQDNISVFENYLHQTSKVHVCLKSTPETSLVSVIDINPRYVPPTETCSSATTLISSLFMCTVIVIFSTLILL